MVVNENILFVLNDKRNCRSNNMIKFFNNKRNKHLFNVIRFEGQLWFAYLWWDNNGRGFVGVRVREVAGKGNKATSCYPSWQRPENWVNVTEWFWGKYKERGMVSLFEIWHLSEFPCLSHKELHTI